MAAGSVRGGKVVNDQFVARASAGRFGIGAVVTRQAGEVPESRSPIRSPRSLPRRDWPWRWRGLSGRGVWRLLSAGRGSVQPA